MVRPCPGKERDLVEKYNSETGKCWCARKDSNLQPWD